MKSFFWHLLIVSAFLLVVFFTHEARSAEYTVVTGDTLSGIAQETRNPVEKLLFLNKDIKNANEIYPGQKIIFLSGLDIRDAYFEASRVREDIPSMAEDIERNKISFSEKQEGLPVKVVLALAEKWRIEQIK